MIGTGLVTVRACDELACSVINHKANTQVSSKGVTQKSQAFSDYSYSYISLLEMERIEIKFMELEKIILNEITQTQENKYVTHIGMTPIHKIIFTDTL
ncbi:protein of unknown function DUF1725 containing protein [Cricetulus griseus]|nr:protein of unknown function DUF1725 containing protein [Cricetulus griseus]